MALVLWPTTGDQGPITALSGDVILSELGQMNGFSVVVPAASERAILAMKEFTEIELEQTGDGPFGVGTIQNTILLNPTQSITDRDEHTITLNLVPLTNELTERLTHRGWTAENFLSVVHSRLVSIVPGWTGIYTGDPTDLVTGGDFVVGVNLNNPTVLGGDLQIAKQFGQFVRQGVDALGVPDRSLEMGQMGAAPTITIQDPKGGSADEMIGNLNVRPVVTVERTPNDVTSLVNVCTPFGGGGSTDSLVDLERCWSIVNDPTYINAGRYGPDAESMARTGMATALNNGDNPTITALPFQAGPSYSSAFIANIPLGTNVSFLSTSGGWSNIVYNGTNGYVDARYLVSSLFPEYDDAYPISDPDNPPTGAIQWLFQDIYGNVFSAAAAAGFVVEIGVRGADGIVPLNVWDASGLRKDVIATFLQGAYNTRYITVDGHFDYMMFDRVSYALYGHKAAEYMDSSLTYADTSIANQELTERALYVSVKTNFLRRSHPHHVFSCTAPGTGRPTRAGDLIAIDVQRVSVGTEDGAAVVEMDVVDNLKVVRVTRSFNGDDPPIDTYVVSNNGRFEDDDTTDGASQAQTIIALQRQQGTGLSGIRLPWPENIDAANPVIIPFYIVPEHFQFHQVRVQVDFLPFRGTATTATNLAGTPVMSADVEVLIKTPNALNAAANTITAMPKHVHRVAFAGSGHVAPDADTPYVSVLASGDNLAFFTNATSGSHHLRTGAAEADYESVDLAPTSHPHVVAAADTAIAHIPEGQRIAALPAHVHDVEKHIPGGHPGEPTPPSPASITLSINGVALSSGKLATGTRDTSGAFTTSFTVNDIGPELNAFPPGTDVPIQFDAGTSASNPFGVGYLRIMITGTEELGGLTSTFQPS